MKNFIFPFLFTFLSVNIFSQFDCVGVPVQTINLCGPETEITLEDREGDCCGGTNCIILQFNVCPDDCYNIQIIGAPAHGAIEIYEGDCNEEIELEDIIEINGNTTILFCKPGNNPYTIVKIPVEPPVFPPIPTITINCSNTIPPVDFAGLLDFLGDEAISIELISEESDNASCPETITRTFKVFHKCGFVILTQKIIIYRVGNISAPPNGSSTVSCPSAAVDPGAPANITDACGRTVSAVMVGQDNPTPACEGTVVWRYRYTACDGTTADWTYTYTIEREDFTIPPNGSSTVSCITDTISQSPPAVTDNCGNSLTPIRLANGGTYAGCEGTVIQNWKYADCEGRYLYLYFDKTICF